MKGDAAILHFVVEQMESLSKYLTGITEDEFYRNELLRDACCMKVLVIGEYCSKVGQQFKSAHPQIDWRLIKEARNYYAHDYGSLTPQKIWRTVKNDIPSLEKTIKEILKEA